MIDVVKTLDETDFLPLARADPRDVARNRRDDPLSPRKLLILQPVRNDRVRAQPAHLVGFVILEVALEPLDMAVALEGEDVRRDAIEKPAVVADDHGASGEILQRLF